VLNEIVWRTQSTDTWVTFKVFGVVPLTFHLRGVSISAANEIRREREGRGEALINTIG
jgi:intracellular septation protein